MLNKPQINTTFEIYFVLTLNTNLHLKNFVFKFLLSRNKFKLLLDIILIILFKIIYFLKVVSQKLKNMFFNIIVYIYND